MTAKHTQPSAQGSEMVYSNEVTETLVNTDQLFSTLPSTQQVGASNKHLQQSVWIAAAVHRSIPSYPGLSAVHVVLYIIHTLHYYEIIRMEPLQLDQCELN